MIERKISGSVSTAGTLLSGTVSGQAGLTGTVIPGSRGAGTSDYERLRNKPQIEFVELIGNKSFEELGLEPITSDELIDILY